MKSKNETVADIVNEMRYKWAQYYFSEGTKRRDGEYSEYPSIDTDELADRIEAANKREIESRAIAAEGAKINERKYTAKEMREMADCISNIKQSEMPSWKEGEIITGGDLCRSAEMLRQAAAVVEREEITEEGA